jgi:hypothetical protein
MARRKVLRSLLVKEKEKLRTTLESERVGAEAEIKNKDRSA